MQILQRVMLNHDIFTNTFHCKELVSDSVLNQVYLSKCTFTNNTDDLEIIKFYIFVSITSSK